MYFLRISGDSIGFVVDSVHAITESDVPITDADYNEYFNLEKQGIAFRAKAVQDKTQGLFGCIEEYRPESIDFGSSEIQELKMAVAEAAEKQEADKLELQLAQAEMLETVMTMIGGNLNG